MNHKEDTVNSSIETLGTHPQNGASTSYQDIPTSFFKPIDEIQEQQKSLLQDYEKQHKRDDSKIEDLNREVRLLEQKLNKKKLYIPFGYVILLVLAINILWFVGVKFIIVPKYENYVEESETIKKNYDSLKRKVEAIVGE